ncbi:hypothetical protein [Bacillus sp. NPDC060175]|uniref:hypothetical protein n=1 Tax=Bacillus sp. NPDC060175 TaxID=3347061 RepID=UPI00364FCAB8
MNLKVEKGSYLVVSEWEFLSDKAVESQQVWYESRAKELMPSAVLYKGIDRNNLVLLYKVDAFSEIQAFIESEEYEEFVHNLAPFMTSDFRQGIYGLADVVKSRDNLVPTTNYMQLRTIEVPLSGIDSYLEWRKGSIFKFVQKNEKVKSFLAFHSVISANPGVLFIAEFEKEPKEFRDSFLTPEYQEIIKEAGHDHIKGGLHTHEYELTVNQVVSNN